MTITLIPDVEKITGKYLREHPAIVALNTRIVGKPPDSRTASWVQLVMLDASKESTSRPEHLVSYLLQLDVYAGEDGGQPEAVLLGRTVRAALVAMPDAQHTDAVCSSVRIVGMIRRADTAMEPARDRVIVTADVGLHA